MPTHERFRRHYPRKITDIHQFCHFFNDEGDMALLWGRFGGISLHAEELVLTRASRHAVRWRKFQSVSVIPLSVMDAS